jgi:NH3-dependent NAD+ synthetase
MIIDCGPYNDKKLFELTLPDVPKIGVFTSGGIDSTILYYLIIREWIQSQSKSQIYPIVIMRKEGSKHFAKPIVEKINQLFNINTTPLRLGNTTLPESQQVGSAIKQAFIYPPYLDTVYIGVINNLEEHLIGFEKIVLPNHSQIKFPFKDLYKSHVIDLYYRLGVENLLQYTHSCDIFETRPCGTCNGCREREWGFNELDKIDPIQKAL